MQAVWEPFGPIGNGFGYPGEYLSVSYYDGMDGRWPGELWMAPAFNAVTLTGGTVANTRAFCDSGGMNATIFIYVARGTVVEKVQISNWAVSTNQLTVAAEALDLIHTRSANDTEEISIAIGNGAAYRVISAVANINVADTESANNEAIKANKFFISYPDDAIGILGAGTGTVPNIVQTNKLSGTVTMDASAVATRATLTGEFNITGAARDGIYNVIGTDRGPTYLNDQFQQFRLLIPDMGRSVFNCAAMRESQYWGLLYSTATGLRRQQGIWEGGSIGLERIATNTSPVQGPVTALAGDGEWDYANVYNPVTGNTYLCAFRPAQPHEKKWETGNPAAWYSLFKYPSSVRSNALYNLDTRAGVLTNPVLVAGNGSNMGYITKGRTWRWPDDTNVTFQTAGTTYLTELRFPAGKQAVISRFGFSCANLASTKTITLKVAVDGGTAVQVGAIANSQPANEWHWFTVPDALRGSRVAPQIEGVGTSGSSPRVVSEMVMDYELEDIPRE